MNRVSLALGLAAMDTCWLYPWCALLGVWSGVPENAPLLSATSLLGLLLIGAFSTQVIGRRVRYSRGGRLGLAAVATTAALLVVRLDHYPNAGVFDWIGPLLGALAVAIGQLTVPVLAFALAVYVWWRGVKLGVQTNSYTEVESAFRWGIGRLIGFALLMAIVARPGVRGRLDAETTPFVVGFFFISLVTLALGRLESLRTQTRNVGINAQWFGVLLVVAGGVVLFALLLGQLVAFDVLILATRPLFDLLGQGLLLIIYAIVIPLAYVLQWLIYLVLSLLRDNASPQPPQPLEPSDINEMLRRFFSEQVPPEVLLALKAAGAASLVGIALLIVARSLSRWRPTSADADATNEERDSLWDRRRMRELLLAWLSRLLRRGTVADESDSSAVAVPAVADAPRLSSVRELYAHLLRLGEANGAPRGSATTPLEHEPALTKRLEPDQAVTDLTDAYVRVRYAELEPSTAETSALRETLEQLHAKNAES